MGRERNTIPVGGVMATLMARRVAVTRALILRGSQVHLAYIRIRGINSDHKPGSESLYRWSCWPAVTSNGVFIRQLSYSTPRALPSPGLTCRFSTPTLPEACA